MRHFSDSKSHGGEKKKKNHIVLPRPAYFDVSRHLKLIPFEQKKTNQTTSSSSAGIAVAHEQAGAFVLPLHLAASAEGRCQRWMLNMSSATVSALFTRSLNIHEARYWCQPSASRAGNNRQRPPQSSSRRDPSTPHTPPPPRSLRRDPFCFCVTLALVS